MVLLTCREEAKRAIERFITLTEEAGSSSYEEVRDALAKVEVGGPVQHTHLIIVSKYLSSQRDRLQHAGSPKDSISLGRLECMLRGASVYQPPPPVKTEPTTEFKALMQKLREDEERRQYERMLNPPPHNETFNIRSPHSSVFDPATSHGIHVPDDVDEVTYADVNRQMVLIINILISIICCSVAIWIAARRWSVPQRLGLSMSGSGLVAAAEVAIYMGYISRIKSAKVKESKQVEIKEVFETWVIDKTAPSSQQDSLRFRKGKHR